ncbi:tRNA (Guanine(10)-N2)-methyltransferase-like protein [Gryllus bimaculatus]|nr:tRNA (Guanine(10)-N2)-methyltransferase-like protein [Gryllus bimaculatus]
MMNGLNWKRYLLWFANEHTYFRINEIESLRSLFGIQMKWVEKNHHEPFCIVDIPTEEDVLKIASRSVSLRSCIELWACGAKLGDLHNNLKLLPVEQLASYFKPELSFKIKVETFCKSQTQEEKVAKIESFSYLPLCGPVKLKNPDIKLELIEYYGLDSNNIPDEPYQVFFGRWVADGQRDLISKLSLKTRKFIGNTSMDPQLSLLMANQAKVKEGDLILDPFVGTGSLLVAAAQFGGYVLGTDIDYLMLHGKTRPTRIQQKKQREKDESVRTNMKQYGIENRYLDVLVADSSLPLWHSAMRLDAIITDPPYGIREATERIGSTKDYQIEEKHLANHIPSKIEYGLQQIFFDLLKLAVEHLKPQGRLVCWIPVVRNDYCESKLPSHPCLQLVANSEQQLTIFTSRRLLTYEKICEHETHLPPNVDLSTAEFRAKFFRYGEEVRKHRKQQKELAMNLSKATVTEKDKMYEDKSGRYRSS